jgi:hypothetical protein
MVQQDETWSELYCVLKGGCFYVFPLSEAPASLTNPAAAPSAIPTTLQPGGSGAGGIPHSTSITKAAALATVDLSSCQVQRTELPGRPHSFVIAHLREDKKLVCMSDDEDEYLAWLVELQGCQSQLTARGRINNVFAKNASAGSTGSLYDSKKQIVSLRKAVPGPPSTSTSPRDSSEASESDAVEEVNVEVDEYEDELPEEPAKRSDWLFMLTGKISKSWKKRWVVLADNTLSISKTDTAKPIRFIDGTIGGL